MMSRVLLSAAVLVAPGIALAAAPSNDVIPVPLRPVIAEAQRSCGETTASGLGYSVLKAAEARRPVQGDVALINYIGYLRTTGAVFDQAAPAPLPVDGVIPGFAEGLKLIPIGGIYRLCVPAALAYGAEAAGDIPPNSDIVFQVEVLDVKTSAEVEAMNRAPQ